MNKQKLMESIAKSIPDDANEKTLELLQAQFEKTVRELPVCNGCGGPMPARWGGTKVDVHWGYYSTGKDTDRDKWNLCDGCTKQWARDGMIPVCSFCRRTIPEAMAELDAKNAGCRYYGDYERALKTILDGGSSLEFATISGCVVCEICYEDRVMKLEVPIGAGRYDLMTGDYEPQEGFQRTNRIQEALEFNQRGLDEDSMTHWYQAKVDYETAVAIRKAPDSDKRIMSTTYVTYKDSKYRSQDDDHIRASTGNYKTLEIPLEWLKLRPNIDLKKPRIVGEGRAVYFGEVGFTAEELVDRFLAEGAF